MPVSLPSARASVTRPIPAYRDAAIQSLSEQLEDTRARRARLRDARRPTALDDRDVLATLDVEYENHVLVTASGVARRPGAVVFLAHPARIRTRSIFSSATPASAPAPCRTGCESQQGRVTTTANIPDPGPPPGEQLDEARLQRADRMPAQARRACARYTGAPLSTGLQFRRIRSGLR